MTAAGELLLQHRDRDAIGLYMGDQSASHVSGVDQRIAPGGWPSGSRDSPIPSSRRILECSSTTLLTSSIGWVPQPYPAP